VRTSRSNYLNDNAGRRLHNEVVFDSAILFTIHILGLLIVHSSEDSFRDNHPVAARFFGPI